MWNKKAPQRVWEVIPLPLSAVAATVASMPQCALALELGMGKVESLTKTAPARNCPLALPLGRH